MVVDDDENDEEVDMVVPRRSGRSHVPASRYTYDVVGGDPTIQRLKK